MTAPAVRVPEGVGATTRQPMPPLVRRSIRSSPYPTMRDSRNVARINDGLAVPPAGFDPR